MSHEMSHKAARASVTPGVAFIGRSSHGRRAMVDSLLLPDVEESGIHAMSSRLRPAASACAHLRARQCCASRSALLHYAEWRGRERVRTVEQRTYSP